MDTHRFARVQVSEDHDRFTVGGVFCVLPDPLILLKIGNCFMLVQAVLQPMGFNHNRALNLQLWSPELPDDPRPAAS